MCPKCPCVPSTTHRPRISIDDVSKRALPVPDLELAQCGSKKLNSTQRPGVRVDIRVGAAADEQDHDVMTRGDSEGEDHDTEAD